MFKESNVNDFNQWISNIVSIDNNDKNNRLNIGKIIGPPTVRKFEQQYSIQLPSSSQQLNTQEFNSFLRANSLDVGNYEAVHDEETVHYIIVKIPEKVFIDSLDIYETACDGALIKIEAQESEDKWMCLWQSDQPHIVNQQRLFRPTITPTSFKCDTLKLTLSNSLHLIDAIEVKGCKKAVLKRGFSIEYDQSSTFDELSKQMYKLVGNELFADIFFEVEGKRVAAHRNILSCRSEYFAAMLNNSANFRESNKQSPIYIPNISYDIFLQVLTFLYTGHIDICKLPCSSALDIIRAADLFNLTKLEELVLFHLAESLDENNIITIFREANETLPILNQVIDLCYDYMTPIFSKVVNSVEFCALSQELMLKIIDNVTPKLLSLKSTKRTENKLPIRNPTFYDDSSSDDD